MSRSEKLNVEITATDKASKPIDAVAKKVDALEDKPHEVTLEADDQATKVVTELDDRLSDLADEDREFILKAQAKQAQTEIDSVTRKLADAQKYDDDTITVLVEARDNAKEKLEKVNAELRDLDGMDVSVDVDADTTGARAGLDGVSRNAKAADASIGALGGAVGELPGLEAFGPLAEGAGQLVEGVLEGEVAMKGLLAAGLGLGAITVITTKVIGHFQDIAETKAFRRERVDEFAEALREAEDGAQALKDTMTDTGKIEFRFLDETVDLVPVLAKAGITADQFFSAVTAGEPALKALATDAKNATGEVSSQALIMLAGEQISADFAAAQLAASQQTAVFGEEVEKATEATDKNTEAVKGSTQAQQTAAHYTAEYGREQARLAGEQEAAAEAADRHRQAEENLMNFINGQLSNVFAYETATHNLANANTDLATKIEEVKTEFDEVSEQSGPAYETALRNLRTEEIKAAEQALTTSEAYAESKGAIAGTEEAARLQKEELIRLQGEFPLLREEIQKYIDILNKIPATKSTVVHLSGSGARLGASTTAPQARALGGPTAAGEMYEVLEGGRSELLEENGRTYLMAGKDGQVTPIAGGTPTANGTPAGGSNVNVVVMIDGQEFKGMIRTEIAEHDRRAAAQLRAGRRS
jgi:hypothetical protein